MKCFVIMPFAQTFNDVFDVVGETVRTATGDTTIECVWLKDVHGAGRITDDIIRELTESAFCISDVTGNNPNVMWETGYAMALDKPTILIGQDIASLPFDLKLHRVVEYNPGALDLLREPLTKAIHQTLSRYELTSLGPPGASTRAPRPERRTIAVTGSMRASQAPVRRRVRATLTPYLGEETSWLVGGIGRVDVEIARFLIEQDQHVTIVGYHKFDFSWDLREEIEAGRLGFIDGSVEQVPHGIEGPSRRDVLLCAKSDLVVLFWDGQSQGTRELIQFFQDRGTATLLAFV